MKVPLTYSCPMDTVRIGYARCSTDRQDLTVQRRALVDLGVDPERIYTDHGFTGRTRARPGLDQALAAVRAGDTLVVTKLDRLARSVPDAREIADQLRAREVKLALGPSTQAGYSPGCQSCLEVVINEAQSSGGLPCASILAKTVYGSVLLPEDRNVRWSLIHA